MNHDHVVEKPDSDLVAELADKKPNWVLYELEKMSESLRGGVTPVEISLPMVRRWIECVEALQRLALPGSLLSLLREAEATLESGRRMPHKRLPKWVKSAHSAMHKAVHAARELCGR